MTVVSVSPADPPATSSAVTVAPLLLVSLTRGARSVSSRVREQESEAGHALWWAALMIGLAQ
jgi:hypothetical protein